MTEMFAQMIIPLAMIFALGYYVKRKRLSWMIFGVMTLTTLLTVPTIITELRTPQPEDARMGVDISSGAMEGRDEVRNDGFRHSGSIATTVISTGSVTPCMTAMPVSGLTQMLSMMTNAFYGGAGAGILNFYIFIILAVFISGLIGGRTPGIYG